MNNGMRNSSRDVYNVFMFSVWESVCVRMCMFVCMRVKVCVCAWCAGCVTVTLRSAM
jgi:hypothetical protein